MELLAQLPSTYVYVQPVKLGGIVVAFALWAMFAQWVDKDTVVVNTFRTLWNLIVVGTGTVALVLALFVSMYAIGLPAMLVINLVVMIVYVIHRNGMVPEKDRVMTPMHFRRLKEEGFSGKKKVKEVKERVRITGPAGPVKIPEEETARDQYALTQDLLFDALWRRAALVEIVPAGQEAAKVNYLIDGIKVDREPLTRDAAEAAVQYMKGIAGLNLEERRKPQSGKITVALGDVKRKMVIRTDGTIAGETLRIRIIYDEGAFKVADLGFQPKQLEVIEAGKGEPGGLILLTASDGNGLTTTVYSFTRTHDRFLQNMQTVEYEVELEIDNVTQNVFVPGGSMTFAERLQKLIRSDPDIVILPEMRDRESAVLAANAAIKRKVYVGLQATDVFDALRKWIASVGDKNLVAKGLRAISNQRLVRLLCRECKEAYKPDPQTMRKLNLPADKILYRRPEPEYDKRGNEIVCQACQGSGYVGRTGVFEWLVVDDPLREVIRNGKSMSEVKSAAGRYATLIGLQTQALHKVLAGETSIQEVARVLRARGDGGGKPKSSGPRPQPKPRKDEGGSPASGGR